MQNLIFGLGGGILIGLAAAGMLLFHGRIAGISGIVGGLFTPPKPGDIAWRGAFIGGLLVTGAVAVSIAPARLAMLPDQSNAGLVVAGLLVGFGTRLGGGCTSGHGVCGVGRLSPRSIVATLTFMITGALSVFVVQHLLTGAS